MCGPRRPQKTYAYYRRTDPAGSDLDRGGAAAPSASTPPSAKSDRASDGNTGEGSPLRRTTSAPRPGHRRQGLLQEPGPSRRLDRPTRSLSQLSPEDISPAHGLGNSTPALVPPADGPARPHTSCNWRAGYYMQETAPPLAPLPRLLDCGTGTATQGDPAHDPTVPAEHIGHRTVSRGGRRDSRYGQKWAGSNGGGRRAEAAVKSSASSRPLLGQRESPLPRREDDAPVFRSSNGSRTHNGCPANHSSCRINSAAGQAAPLAGEAGDASPPP
jgi:hypothetical protein